MKKESTILKIKQELISMFASLDTWFDKLLDEGFDPEEETDALEVVEHILESNVNLLAMLSVRLESEFQPRETDSELMVPGPLDELRLTSRGQLHAALYLLDSLDEPSLVDRLDHERQMELHEKLFSIAQHLRYHLELLQVEEGIENH